MRTIRKKTIIAGTIAAAVVAVGCYSAVTFLNIQNSKAAFQKQGKVEAEVQAGNLEFTMSKLENLDVTKATTTFDATGADVASVPVGNTTIAGTVLSYTENFNDIYPGWKGVYGFEVKNTGSLKSFLDMYLGTMYVSPTDNTVSWDEQDPRERIKFTVYSGSTLSAAVPQVATGHLQGSTVVIDTKTENDQYGNFQVPGKIPGTNNELSSNNSKIYYIIVLEFEDNAAAWVGNDAGDNIYEKSKFKVNFAIGTAGPLTTGFKFE